MVKQCGVNKPHDNNEETAMLITFGLGIVVGIVIVIGLLRMTCQEEPTGCIILLGSLCFLLCWGLGAVWLVLSAD